MNELIQKIRAALRMINEDADALLKQTAEANHAALLSGVQAKTVDMAGDAAVESGDESVPVGEVGEAAAATKEDMPPPPDGAMAEPPLPPESEEPDADEMRLAAIEKVVAELAARLDAIEGASATRDAEISALREDVQMRATATDIADTAARIEQLADAIKSATAVATANQLGARAVKETPMMIQVLNEERAAGLRVDTVNPAGITFVP